jgi:hypothetical protein
MRPAQISVRRCCAELGLLDAAARRADEMVMVLGPAANVGVTALTEERVDGSARP